MVKPWVNGGFHKWVDPQKWMVYTGQLLGNLHMGVSLGYHQQYIRISYGKIYGVLWKFMRLRYNQLYWGYGFV